jgi:hypothetical protein
MKTCPVTAQQCDRCVGDHCQYREQHLALAQIPYSSAAPAPHRGMWGPNDPRSIFVQGARWWQYAAKGSTAFPSEVHQMEAEAERQFPNGQVPKPSHPFSSSEEG